MASGISAIGLLQVEVANGETGQGPRSPPADGRGSGSVFELTSVYCPECGDDAEDVVPENGQDFRELPWYRHVGIGLRCAQR